MNIQIIIIRDTIGDTPTTDTQIIISIKKMQKSTNQNSLLLTSRLDMSRKLPRHTPTFCNKNSQTFRFQEFIFLTSSSISTQFVWSLARKELKVFFFFPIMTYCYYGHCYCGRCRSSPSSPLPYSVLLFLALALMLLALSSLIKFEIAIGSAEDNMTWLVLLAAIALLVLVRWLSADSCRPPHYCGCGGRCMPWKYCY